MNKKDWYLFITLLFIFLMLFLVTARLLYIINPDIFKCSFNDLSTLLGVVISCFALIITAYFVVMAINAYGHIKEINKVKEKAEDANNLLIEVSDKSKDISAEYEEIRNKSKDISAEYDEIKQNAEKVNELFTDITNKNFSIGKGFKRYETKLKLLEIRSIYIYPFLLDENTKLSYLINLAILGEACDIMPIEKISKDNNESEKIRKTAKEVVKELRRRFKMYKKKDLYG